MPRPTRLLRVAVLFAALISITLAAALPASAAPAAGTTTLTGTVTGSDGRPLKNVQVAVEKLYPGTFPVIYSAWRIVSTTTAADGTYRLVVERQGDLHLQFDAAAATGGSSATGYADSCYQGPAVCQYDGPTFDLTRQATRRIDTRLGRASVLQGRVTDALGRSVVGLSVTTQIANIGVPDRGLEQPDFTATTDVNGNYSFGRVNPLQYGVLFGDGEGGPSIVEPSPFGYFFSGAAESVAPGKVVAADGVVRGAGGIATRVVDQFGAPVPDAYVQVVDFQEGDLTPAPSTTIAPGRVRTVGLPAGDYRLCVSAANYLDRCDDDAVGPLTVKNFAYTPVTVVLQRAS